MPKGLFNMDPIPTEEDAGAFITYRNYLDAFSQVIDDALGTDLSGLPKVMGASQFHDLKRAVKVDSLVTHLRSAWSTELLMTSFRALDLGDVVRYANVWVPVQSYYAVFAAILALQVASGSEATSHTAVLNSIGNEMRSRKWLPPPWTAVCLGCPQVEDYVFEGVSSAADRTISNLKAPFDMESSWSLVAKCLGTTREHIVDDAIKEWKKNNKNKKGKPRKLLYAHEKAVIAKKEAPTTLFDFLYRMRIRSNYRDTDAFALGASSPAQAGQFYDLVSKVTSATLRFVETLVVGRIGVKEFESVLLSYRNQYPRARLRVVEYWRDVAGLTKLPAATPQ
ncbi:MAG: hypothetical protein IIA90_03025 [Chloroflexi bacterium]|nr:hypothetical protein [Chloroflexota bacterium]